MGAKAKAQRQTQTVGPSQQHGIGLVDEARVEIESHMALAAGKRFCGQRLVGLARESEVWPPGVSPRSTLEADRWAGSEGLRFSAKRVSVAEIDARGTGTPQF